MVRPQARGLVVWFMEMAKMLFSNLRYSYNAFGLATGISKEEY